MLRLSLLSWAGVTNAILTICVVALKEDSQMPKLHMGILTSYQDISSFPSGKKDLKPEEIDLVCYKRFQCSYALSALRHLKLTEKVLYKPNGELKKILKYKVMMFDTEAALMLKTVHFGPFPDDLQYSLWALWFYTVRLHSLQNSLVNFWMNSTNLNTMIKVHQSVKESLLLFVESNMSKIKGVEEKLNDIKQEKIEEKDVIHLISENKDKLEIQIVCNNLRGVSTNVKLNISFENIATFDKIDGIKSIVVEYLGKHYWAVVNKNLQSFYTTAISLDVPVSHQIAYLWHIKNGIVKILKLILANFIENYLDFSSTTDKTFQEIQTLDKTMVKTLMEFYESIGEEESKDNSIVQNFQSRSENSSDFNLIVKENIKRDIQFYPNLAGIYIKKYYFILTDESNIKISDKFKSWEIISSFVQKVKHLFSDIEHIIRHSFDQFVFFQPFQSMENAYHNKDTKE